LVEPLPFYYDLYASERPRDIVVKGAVYWKEMPKQGYVRKRGQHGGGSYVVTGVGHKHQYFPCSFFRINDILENNFDICPHYLSIDIEGSDFFVIQDLDFCKYPIPVVCGEFKKLNMALVDDFMFSKGYSIKKQTISNFLYMR
jgi:hypothetical protein